MKNICLCLIFSTSSLAKSYIPATFSANFEERTISLATGKEKISTGKIDYKYPGHIRFEVLTPNASLFVSNLQKSWYYVPPFIEKEQGQVTIQKSNNQPLTKFLDSVKDGLDSSKIFTYKFVGKDLILTFLPKIRKEMRLKEVVLHASKEASSVEKLGEFETMTLLNGDGQKVNLKFRDLKESISFPEKHFEFTTPANTKVTEG